MFVARFTDDELAAAVAASLSWADVLRALGYQPRGGNFRTVRRHAARLRLSTEHFDPGRARRAALGRPARPLGEVLVERSSYARHSLKLRLFAAGLKEPRCEMCGQGELWRGARMALILDHINGVADDNRLENLRILCPNCNATLATHCGRKNRLPPEPRDCKHCGEAFMPKHSRHWYCGPSCGQRAPCRAGTRPQTRRVERPPYEQLLAEIEATSWSAVGRRYGVSDNAVRKWVRQYERERAPAEQAPP
jgi:ribosomal protein S27AE